MVHAKLMGVVRILSKTQDIASHPHKSHIEDLVSDNAFIPLAFKGNTSQMR